MRLLIIVILRNLPVMSQFIGAHGCSHMTSCNLKYLTKWNCVGGAGEQSHEVDAQLIWTLCMIMSRSWLRALVSDPLIRSCLLGHSTQQICKYTNRIISTRFTTMWDGPKFISIRTMKVYMLGRKQLRKFVTDNVKVTKATSSMPMFFSEISLQ